MSKAREKLAATLINHVHVIEHSLAIGRRSRRPTSKRYAEVASIDCANTTVFNEVIKSFTAFNSKHFIENIRFLVDALAGKSPELKVIWSPKILVRGLSGKIVASDIDYNVAVAVIQAMTFAGQSPEVLAALELCGGVHIYEHAHVSMDVLIPAFKNTPFCNLQREQVDCTKILTAKMLIMQLVAQVVSGLSNQQRAEVANGRAYVKIHYTTEQNEVHSTGFSLEETESVRAERIARERLEELRRRRHMTIHSISSDNNRLTYDVSTTNSADEHCQLSITMDTLFGW